MKKANITGKLRACFCAVMFIFLFTVPLWSQKPAARSITGKVMSSRTQNMLEGATVSVKGTQNVVKTGANGEFHILAQTGETIVVTYVSYKSKQIKVTDATASIVFELEEDLNTLQDVVVLGYGKTKKSDLSSAVGTITNADLEKTVNTTIDQALQGRAANVYVSSPSGQPGAGASVIIRGISSISGNSQPLYVIDGVQIRPSAPSGGAYNQPAGYANEVSGLNTDDIENISILQGAAATSIFGAAGSNGVLMITTKRGKSGSTKINASSLFSEQDLPKFRPVMDLPQYARYIQKLQALGATGSQSPEISDPSILGPGTNWQAELFKRTLLEKHSIAISGGSDKATIYFSGDYLKQNGMAKGSGFTRGSARVNFDITPNKWLKFGASLNPSITKEIVNTTNGNIINIAITQNPTIPLKTLMAPGVAP